MFCNRCGHKNPDGANFCSSCGGILEPDDHDHNTITFHPDRPADPVDDEVTVDLDDLPDDVGVLVVKRGPKAGVKFALDQAVTTAGRHPDSDIFLDDVTVSRRHAEIERDGDHYVVRDVGSLNGTYVNRQRIDEVTASNGDELQVGKFRLIFYLRVAGA